jgi:hypothetical protein
MPRFGNERLAMWLIEEDFGDVDKLHKAIASAIAEAFDDLGYGRSKKLPTVAALRADYAAALAEKKKAHTEDREAKSEVRGDQWGFGVLPGKRVWGLWGSRRPAC